MLQKQNISLTSLSGLNFNCFFFNLNSGEIILAIRKSGIFLSLWIEMSTHHFFSTGKNETGFSLVGESKELFVAIWPYSPKSDMLFVSKINHYLSLP